MPVLISLETSDNEAIAERAFGLHSVLQNKHASIINTRYLESVKMAFQYRQKLHLPISGKYWTGSSSSAAEGTIEQVVATQILP